MFISQTEVIEKELDKLEKQRLIEPRDSPWAAPLVIVTKKCGSLRVCTDFRSINNIFRNSAADLPNTKDCLASSSGYHQIPIKQEYKCKRAFYTKRGLMQYTVMLFGLTGAPSTFENLIEKVTRGMQWEMCVLYLDDVIYMISQKHTKTYRISLKDF